MLTRQYLALSVCNWVASVAGNKKVAWVQENQNNEPIEAKRLSGTEENSSAGRQVSIGLSVWAITFTLHVVIWSVVNIKILITAALKLWKHSPHISSSRLTHNSMWNRCLFLTVDNTVQSLSEGSSAYRSDLLAEIITDEIIKKNTFLDLIYFASISNKFN